MGTHPIFESDFDCLTELIKRMLRFTCLRNVQIRPLNYSFRNQARVRRDKNFITEAEGASHIPGYSTGAKLTAGCAALGIGALAYNGLNVGNNLRAVDRAAVWPQYIKQRIGMSYQYLAQGLVITALSSMAVIRSPRMMSLAASGGWLSLFGTIAGMVGLQIATRASPYDSIDCNVWRCCCSSSPIYCWDYWWNKFDWSYGSISRVPQLGWTRRSCGGMHFDCCFGYSFLLSNFASRGYDVFVSPLGWIMLVWFRNFRFNSAYD